MTAKERIQEIYSDGLRETKGKVFPQVRPQVRLVAEEVQLPPRCSPCCQLPLLSDVKRARKSEFDAAPLEAAICQLHEANLKFI